MKTRAIILAASTIWIFLGSGAQAGTTICNKYPLPIHVALASAAGGSYSASGWWTVAPNACDGVDFALQGNTIYYAGDSDSFVKDGVSQHFHWGAKVQLYVSSDKFNFTGAEKSRSGTKPEMFDAADVSLNPQPKVTAITITFTETQGSTVNVVPGN
jgi:uncharacterized membrane protein